ncbi:hypothetical protein AGLY_014087 [Aphis glycines]|uniref:Uncharacterized protein n=1 Tax=Aphis glycines TaxID=307491 RepID=A0A6G0T497_APHGL|nr:hypothetical protein AGLY_014087 [Aphis glycines]
MSFKKSWEVVMIKTRPRLLQDSCYFLIYNLYRFFAATRKDIRVSNLSSLKNPSSHGFVSYYLKNKLIEESKWMDVWFKIMNSLFLFHTMLNVRKEIMEDKFNNNECKTLPPINPPTSSTQNKSVRTERQKKDMIKCCIRTRWAHALCTGIEKTILNGVMNFEFIRNMSKLRKFAIVILINGFITKKTDQEITLSELAVLGII